MDPTEAAQVALEAAQTALETSQVTQAALEAAQGSQTLQLIAVSISLLATVAALIAAWASMRSARVSEQHSSQNMTNEVLNMHNHFQAQVRNIQNKLPPEVNDLDWKPSRDDQRQIRMYWYAVLDEWIATMLVGANTDHMWQDYYRNGVKGALSMNNGTFEAELCEMVASGTTFSGQKDKFINEINSICLEVNGRPLKLKAS